MTYKLLEGDALIQLQFVKAESIDTVFTSPQPPESYDQMLRLEQIMLQLPRVLKETGSIWINLGDQHTDDGVLALIPQRFVYDMVVEHNWKLRGEILWYRPSPFDWGGWATRRFKRTHEFVYWFVKDVNKYYINTEMSSAVNLESDVITTKYHEPRQGVFESGFPTDLIEKTAILTTPSNGRILDPFAGTATTGVVALTHNREFLGIEANPKLIDQINDRLSEI
jgi:site-specific DNA-methyltransferase (adenine-specific)